MDKDRIQYSNYTYIFIVIYLHNSLLHAVKEPLIVKGKAL